MDPVAKQQRQTAARNHANDSANRTEGYGFDEELQQDIAALGTNGLPHTNFAGPLGHGDQHDIHDADATDEQSHGSDREHQHEDQVADLVPKNRRK